MEMSFGHLLRQWRTSRGQSQLDLAWRAGFSQRHVSFLETGRSRPSRSTVVILAEALEVPVGARNSLLHAAGFASLYSAEPADSQQLKWALAALDSVVASHRPFPALIVDRGWNLHSANVSALALFQRFLPAPELLATAAPVNVIRLALDPAGLRGSIVNWAGFAHVLLGQLKQEQAHAPADALGMLIADIESDPEFQAHGREAAAMVDTPVATLRLARDGFAVSLFTLVSSFAASHDAHLSDLRVETFFPADEGSREILLAMDAAINDGGA
ncbi:MAG: helix-turn-helix transcriptional regulator [Pseudomonadales bacterium]|nr:helix-turn-helix transcriptional regulator [Pseudomonadales bacterium]